MNKMLLLLALFGLALAEGERSDVTTVVDKTFKNPDAEVDGRLKGCPYVRSYTLRKQLVLNEGLPESEQHKAIFYHNVDCLDVNLEMVQGRDTYTRFSYDDDLLPADQKPVLMDLPEGCPPTVISRTPTLCENGVELGKHIVSDVTEVLTKQMAEGVNKPLSPEEESTFDSETVTKIEADLKDLEEKIAKLVNSTHDDIEPEADEVEEFPNGVIAKKFTFPNSTVSIVSRPGATTAPQPGTDNTPVTPTHQPPFVGVVHDDDGNEVDANATNGLGPHQVHPGKTMLPKDLNEVEPGFFHSVVVTIVKSDDGTDEVVEKIVLETMTDETTPRSVTKRWVAKGPNAGTSTGPDGEEGTDGDAPLEYMGMVERLPNTKDNSSYVETEYDNEGVKSEPVVFNAPFEFYRPPPPKDVELTPEFLESLGNVTEEFVEELEKLVSEKSLCLLDKIFHQKEYKIELVCSKTAAEDGQKKTEILNNSIVKQLFCGGGNCDAFLRQVQDDMIAHTYAGKDPADFHIKSETYKGKIEQGAAH